MEESLAETGEGRTPNLSAVADALRNLSQALGRLADAIDDGTRADRFL